MQKNKFGISVTILSIILSFVIAFVSLILYNDETIHAGDDLLLRHLPVLFTVLLRGKKDGVIVAILGGLLWSLFTPSILYSQFYVDLNSALGGEFREVVYIFGLTSFALAIDYYYKTLGSNHFLNIALAMIIEKIVFGYVAVFLLFRYGYGPFNFINDFVTSCFHINIIQYFIMVAILFTMQKLNIKTFNQQ